MSESQDFERAWLTEFAICLAETGGEDIRQEVRQGSENPSMATSRQDVIAWSQQVMRSAKLKLRCPQHNEEAS